MSVLTDDKKWELEGVQVKKGTVLHRVRVQYGDVREMETITVKRLRFGFWGPTTLLTTEDRSISFIGLRCWSFTPVEAWKKALKSAEDHLAYAKRELRKGTAAAKKCRAGLRKARR